MLEAFELYLEGLCRKNKKVQHGINKRRSWIAFSSEESPVNNSNLASPYVRHLHFFGAGRDHTQWIYTSELMFLVNVSVNKGKLEEQITKARNESQAIMLQFDAKLIADQDNGVTCHLFDDILEVEMEPVSYEDQSAFGWLYTFKFIVPRDETNDADWEEDES